MPKTYGQQFDEALLCQTPEEAQAWLESEIERYVVEYGKSREEARCTILTNVGYMTGYHDARVGRRIRELFGVGHPIFGALG